MGERDQDRPWSEYCRGAARERATHRVATAERVASSPALTSSCAVVRGRDGRLLAADGVALLDGEVVLLERDHPPSKGQWVLPDGFVQRDERTRTACRREVREEVCLDVEPVVFVGLEAGSERDKRGTVSGAYDRRPREPATAAGPRRGPPGRDPRSRGPPTDGLRPRADRGRRPRALTAGARRANC